MDAHHDHGHEVVKSGIAEALMLIFQREREIECLMEETKAEAEKIIEAAKKEAQEIKNKREEARREEIGRQEAKQRMAAAQQQKGKAAASTVADNLAMTEEEKKEVQKLKELAAQNTGRVIEMVLKEVVP